MAHWLYRRSSSGTIRIDDTEQAASPLPRATIVVSAIVYKHGRLRRYRPNPRPMCSREYTRWCRCRRGTTARYRQHAYLAPRRRSHGGGATQPPSRPLPSPPLYVPSTCRCGWHRQVRRGRRGCRPAVARRSRTSGPVKELVAVSFRCQSRSPTASCSDRLGARRAWPVTIVAKHMVRSLARFSGQFRRYDWETLPGKRAELMNTCLGADAATTTRSRKQSTPADSRNARRDRHGPQAPGWAGGARSATPGRAGPGTPPPMIKLHDGPSTNRQTRRTPGV